MKDETTTAAASSTDAAILACVCVCVRPTHTETSSPDRRDAAARIGSRTGDPATCADNGNTDRTGRIAAYTKHMDGGNKQMNFDEYTQSDGRIMRREAGYG